jgi:hypothetical protein
MKEPDTYLGSQVSKFYIDGAENPEKPHWAMSSEAYVKQAVADVEVELSKVDLIRKGTIPDSRIFYLFSPFFASHHIFMYHCYMFCMGSKVT